MSEPSASPAPPRVSVVIAAYNAAATLGETLRSVRAQACADVEVVVVDDGSTDATRAMLEAEGARVRAFHQENAGIGAARNRGMREARGAFIALIDADDVCEPGRLRIQLDYLLAHPDLLLCSTDFSSFDDSGMIEASSIGSYYSRCGASHGGVRARYDHHAGFALPVAACGRAAGSEVASHSGRVFEQLLLGNFIHPPTVMFRREALELAGNFDPSIRIACEWEWLVRVAQAGPVGYIDLPLLRYRRSASQISSSTAMNLDSLRVAKAMQRRYARLRVLDPRVARRQLGQLELQAAYAMAPVRRIIAFALLASSVMRRGVLGPLTLPTCARVLLPSAALRGLRAARRRLRPAS